MLKSDKPLIITLGSPDVFLNPDAYDVKPISSDMYPYLSEHYVDIEERCVGLIFNPLASYETESSNKLVINQTDNIAKSLSYLSRFIPIYGISTASVDKIAESNASLTSLENVKYLSSTAKNAATRIAMVVGIDISAFLKEHNSKYHYSKCL